MQEDTHGDLSRKGRENLPTTRYDLGRIAAESSHRLVELTRALVAIPSAYPPGDTRSIAKFISDQFSGYPVEVKRYKTLPHVTNLVVRLRGGRPGRRLVFNGHLDTFPLVNREAWSTSPEGEVRDGRLYGLGVSDMKGGIAAIIFAMQQLAAVRETLKGEVVATFVGDEETMGSEGTGYLLDHVKEASGDAMICADAGSPNVLRFGEKGMIWLKLDATGRSAHAAHVHRGVSAIDRLLAVMLQLKSLQDSRVDAPIEVLEAIGTASDVSERLSGIGESDVLRKVTVSFGTLKGGKLPNLIADRAAATADIRLPVGVSVATIEAEIERIVAHHEGVSVDITRRYEPNWTAPHHEIVRCVRKNCLAKLHEDVVVNMRVGASDARHYRMRGVPTVVCGLTSYNMGSADEHIHLRELKLLGEIFTLTAFDYLQESGEG
jgi:succinyl-diaminopimelate desuccinylase